MPPLNRDVIRRLERRSENNDVPGHVEATASSNARPRAAVVVGAITAILVGGFLVSRYIEGRREPSQEARNPVPSRASVVVEAPSADAKNGQGASSGDTARLREMSQSFRHSTFLIAIRYAGFYCDDVVTAHESGDGIWIASCTDAREYKVSARPTDELSVEAIYFEAPLRNPQLQFDRNLPFERLEQERLRR